MKRTIFAALLFAAPALADDHRPGVEKWAPRPEIGRPVAAFLLGASNGIYEGIGDINRAIVDAERSVGLIPPAPPRKR